MARRLAASRTTMAMTRSCCCSCDRRSSHPLRLHHPATHRSSEMFRMDTQMSLSASRQTEFWTEKRHTKKRVAVKTFRGSSSFSLLHGEFRFIPPQIRMWNPLYDYANGMEMITALCHKATAKKREKEEKMKIDLSDAFTNKQFSASEPSDNRQFERERVRVWWMSRNRFAHFFSHLLPPIGEGGKQKADPSDLMTNDMSRGKGGQFVCIWSSHLTGFFSLNWRDQMPASKMETTHLSQFRHLRFDWFASFIYLEIVNKCPSGHPHSNDEGS